MSDEVSTPSREVGPTFAAARSESLNSLALKSPTGLDLNVRSAFSDVHRPLPSSSQPGSMTLTPADTGSTVKVTMTPLTVNERMQATLAAPTVPEERAAPSGGEALRHAASAGQGEGASSRRASAGRVAGALAVTSLGLAGLFNMQSRIPGAATHDINIGVRQSGPTSSQPNSDWRVRLGGNKVGVTYSLDF